MVEEGPEAAEAFFNQWVTEVKAEVPEERLLVFEAKEGWKPLCEFLGLPEPGRVDFKLLTKSPNKWYVSFLLSTDIPFPRLNDTPEMRRHARIGKILSYVIIVVVPILLVIGVIVGLLVAFV